MLDPREEFLTDVKFCDVYIKEYPKIAFLCGGTPTSVHDNTENKRHFLSVRSYIASKLEINFSSLVFVNAEDVKDWSSYNIYSDLIEFERDVAHISKSIVLFVESPGSIAELGSFSIIPEISRKLSVFVHQDFSTEDSYISLGPLKKLANNKSNIHYIKWSIEEKTINGNSEKVFKEGSMPDWDDYVCNAIKESIDKVNRIDKDNDEYIRTKEILFMHDLIILFTALNEDEIEKYFKLTGYEISMHKLMQGLFCLKKLNLIRSVKTGNKTFYTPFDANSKRYISIPRAGDTARLAMSLGEYYLHHSQLARRDAIQGIVS